MSQTHLRAASVLAAAGYGVGAVLELVRDQPSTFTNPVDYVIEAAFVVGLVATVAVLVGLARRQRTVGSRIAPFVENLKVSFPVVRDHDGSLRAAWHVTVFPSTFVVTPDRRVVLVATGEIDWDDPKVESRIRSLR